HHGLPPKAGGRYVPVLTTSEGVLDPLGDDTTARARTRRALRSQHVRHEDVPPLRHHHPFGRTTSRTFATNVRCRETRVQARPAKSEVHAAASSGRKTPQLVVRSRKLPGQ